MLRNTFLFYEVFINKPMIMNKNRFKELMKSTLGNVKPLISEQGEPTTPTTPPTETVTPPTTDPPTPTAVSSGTDPKIILVRDTVKIISKVTPITDKEIESNIRSALRVLFGVTPHNTKSLDERMRTYDYKIEKFNLSSYLPSSELIVKLKAIQ